MECVYNRYTFDSSTKHNTMTLQQITNNLNNSQSFQFRSEFPAKLWAKDNIARIYIGANYIQVKGGVITMSSHTSRGYYERKCDYNDRAGYVSSVCEICARYVKFYISK